MNSSLQYNGSYLTHPLAPQTFNKSPGHLLDHLWYIIMQIKNSYDIHMCTFT